MAKAVSVKAQGRRIIDIGANLLDPMFNGVYHGKTRHSPDLSNVLQRAAAANVERVIVTAGTLSEAREAVQFCAGRPHFYTTVGVHPTRCNEFDAKENGGPDEYQKQLLEVAQTGKQQGTVVAIGECGLDYDRLQFCDKQTQLAHFHRHFDLAEATGLPMFLHNRNTNTDMVEQLTKHRHRFTNAVVHSFDGSPELLKQLLALDLYIGINGCSLRTADNLETVKAIPLDRLMVETDAPWCGIKATHAGHASVKTTWPTKRDKKYEPDIDVCVKNRNEPCHIVQVLEVIAALKHVKMDELCSQVYDNTLKVFFPTEWKELHSADTAT